MLQILLSVWILDVGILYYKSKHFLKYLILMLTNWVWMWAITETITMISRHMSWIDRKYKCRVLFALYLLSHWFLGVFGWRPVCRQWSIRSWALSTVCSDWNCWQISDDHNHWLQPLFSQQLKPRAVMSDCGFFFFLSPMQYSKRAAVKTRDPIRGENLQKQMISRGGGSDAAQYMYCRNHFKCTFLGLEQTLLDILNLKFVVVGSFELKHLCCSMFYICWFFYFFLRLHKMQGCFFFVLKPVLTFYLEVCFLLGRF